MYEVGLRRKLIVFTAVQIRLFEQRDLDSTISLYQRAFREPPWNETWTREQVEEDLRFAQTQPNPILLVALLADELVGFTWGYQLPFEKMLFLTGRVLQESSYIDEVAVAKDARIRGIGVKLCNAYTNSARTQGMKQLVLRTSVNNPASVALFTKVGFTPLCAKEREGLYDPVYQDRLYFWRAV